MQIMQVIHKKTIVALLLSICIFAAFIRIYRIDSAPRGATVDEIHFGYLAYSIGETGNDEHGVHLPLIFKGFGDDKLPLQTYILVPIVKFFGLNNTTVRIPSIVAGLMLILVMYALVRELGMSRSAGIFTAMIVAISPWSFFLSRFGYESNLGLLLFSASLYFSLRGLREKKLGWMIASSVLLGLTWYAYIAFRPVSVLFAALTSYLYLRNGQKPRRQAIIIISVFILMIVPLLLPRNVGSNATRFKQVGILSDPGLSLEVNEDRTFCVENLPREVCYFTFNKPFLALRKLSARYLYSLGPDFLFLEGEKDQGMMTVKGFAQLYLVLLPFYILGISSLITEKKTKLIMTRDAILIIGLLISPIPAALVGDAQKVRISVLLPFVLIAIAIGFDISLNYARKKVGELKSIIFLVFVVLVIFTEALIYFTSWFGVHTSKNSQIYQSYVPEIVNFITSHPKSKINIVPFYSDPIMFFAYYSKFDPLVYQREAILGDVEDSGFQHTVELGRITAYSYSIETFSCSIDQGKKGYYVTDQELTQATEVGKIMSDNGVDTLVRMYSSISSEKLDCN